MLTIRYDGIPSDLCPNVTNENVRRRRGATASDASDPLDTGRRLDTFNGCVGPIMY
jgi:hypothetical protein